MDIEPGLRVVRGPDWKWDDQDGGEGYLGTVAEAPAGDRAVPEGVVVVQWDVGNRCEYRCGIEGKYDLKVYDNAPTGNAHPHVLCDSCHKRKIPGIRWKCTRCYDFDLCTPCYYSGKHYLDHPFWRIDKGRSHQGVVVPTRESSRKVLAKGFFQDAEVARGRDWLWGDQDGGLGNSGVVKAIKDHTDTSRSIVEVEWIGSHNTNLYRAGHKGKVDVKCMTVGVGNHFYPDHLLVLGVPAPVEDIRDPQQQASPLPSPDSSTPKIKAEDQVKVQLEIDVIKMMQVGHGGWNDQMAEVLSEVGTVHTVLDSGDIRVRYPSNLIWTMNPDTVTVLEAGQFSVGDVVRVLDGITKVHNLQENHGGWVDDIALSLGQVGRITKVLPTGDVRANVNGRTWTFNPACLIPAPGKAPAIQKIQQHKAYERALSGEKRLKMMYLKFISFGLPRSGKSSTFKRLIGEIINLRKLGGVSRSTGVAECRDVIIKPFKSVPAAIVGSDETLSKWESLKSKPTEGNEKASFGDSKVDHKYLAHLYFHLISSNATEITTEDKPNITNKGIHGQKNEAWDTNVPHSPLAPVPTPIQPNVLQGQLSALAVSNMPSASELSDVEAAVKELSSILQLDSPKEFQLLLEKLIMLNVVDVGGQPGFVEMLPAFTTGSALYFLFFRMDQEIRKLYPVRFLAADSDEEIVLESSYCIEDVLCQLVSSISCFESVTRSTQSPTELKSRALLFGTFKDQIKGPDMLDSCCRKIEDTLWKILSSMQEDLLLEADEKRKFFMIDNMDGDDDIDSIRKTIEDIIRCSFSQTEVPPSWLMFRILLILVGKPVVSLNLCRALANRLKMPTPVEDAIQFFHHHVGSLMHYPEVESIEDMVICDPQVIFDSISELVINTFRVTNRAIPRSARIEFELKGFFTLKDIECITDEERKSHLTSKQLVDLLKHVGILAEIQDSSSTLGASSKFIIPAVLKNASEEEHIPDSSHDHTFSIMVHFDCGFVPYGIFCFAIAHLISHQGMLTLEWKLRKDLPIKKNKVVFLVDGRFDITLVSRPQYLEIQLCQCSKARKKEKSLEEVCSSVREQISVTLTNIIKKMKYKQSICAVKSERKSFSMAFPCSKYTHNDHLMIIIEDDGYYAQCLKDESEISLTDQLQLVWYSRHQVSSANPPVYTSPHSGTLNINHLAQVQRAIWEGRTEWRNLGLEVGVSADSLEAISRNHPQSVNDCFREMLSEWLRSGRRPNFKDLIDALESPTVGLENLAGKLRET